MKKPLNLPYLDKPNGWSSHAKIVNFLKTLPAGAKILDVGAATGTIARWCSGRDLVFYGIEPNPEWAEIAQPHYAKMVIKTVEQVPTTFMQGYDAVVCGDVLEHTVDPWGVLKKIQELQSPGCFFVISLPNIANLWVRLSLAMGRFDYTERGILDQTHLRFFTRKTAIALVNKAGLDIKNILVTPIPLDLVSPFFAQALPGKLFYRFLNACTSIFPTLLGYQFVIIAQKAQK